MGLLLASLQWLLPLFTPPSLEGISITDGIYHLVSIGDYCILYRSMDKLTLYITKVEQIGAGNVASRRA